jgi:hypothetical protein
LILLYFAQHDGQRQSSTARPEPVTARTHRHPCETLIRVESSSGEGATAPHPTQMREPSSSSA